LVAQAFEANKQELDEKQWDFQMGKLNTWCREQNKWADARVVNDLIAGKMVELYG